MSDLTPAQIELIEMLAEEAGEVVQICMKILRHGASSYHPADPVHSNSSLLAKEADDFCTVLREIGRTGLYPRLPSDRMMDETWKRKLRYTHHQRRPA